MSISTTATKDSYAGNNSIVTQYPITFKYFEESHISVYFDGVLQTKGAGADYVMGGDGTTSTGYITTNVAQADTVTVAIVLDVPFDQPVVLQETGSLPAKTIEVEGFDRLNMQVRRVWRKLQDVLTFSSDEAGASTGTADNLIGFDGSGDIAEVPNTTFLQTANDLSDVDAATARTNLGVDPAGTRFALSELTDATITNPVSGETIEWNGSAWVNSLSNTQVDTSDTAPVSPNDGDLWYDSTSGLMYVYYYDGSSSQWVTITSAVSSLDASSVAYTPAGTGAVVTDLQTKLRESVSVKDFGAVGDGVADDTTAIQNALSAGAGGVIYFPAGTYKYTPTTSGTVISSNTTILGAGRYSSILALNITGTLAYKVFSCTSQSNIEINGLGINTTVSSPYLGASLGILDLPNNNFTGRNLHVDGGGDFNGSGVISITTWLFGYGSDVDKTDITFQDIEVEGIDRVLLRGNAITSTTTNLRIINCSSTGGTGIDFSFNDPQGITKSMMISGCHARGNVGNLSASEDESYFVAMAHVEDGIITGNTFSGDVGASAVHLENKTRNVSVTGNSFNLSSGDGIRYAQVDPDWEVGATYYRPKDVVISGNTFHHDDVSRADRGIWIQDGTTDIYSADRLLISDNTFHGFDVAIALNSGVGTETVVCRDNYITDCNIGIDMLRYSLVDAADSIIEGCDVGVNFTNGGMIKNPVFKNNTNNIAMDDLNERAVIVNPSFRFDPLTLSASSTREYILLPSFVRCEGEANVSVQVVDTATGTIVSQRVGHFTLRRTGASLVDTSIFEYDSNTASDMTFDFLNFGGGLALRVTDTSATQRIIQAQINLQGTYVCGN